MIDTFEKARALLRTVEDNELLIARNAAQITALEAQVEAMATLRARWRDLLLNDTNSLPEAVLKYEREILTVALTEARGSVTAAGPLLGMTYQAIGYMLKSRHKGIKHLRTELKLRKQSSQKR